MTVLKQKIILWNERRKAKAILGWIENFADETKKKFADAEDNGESLFQVEISDAQNDKGALVQMIFGEALRIMDLGHLRQSYEGIGLRLHSKIANFTKMIVRNTSKQTNIADDDKEAILAIQMGSSLTSY